MSKKHWEEQCSELQASSEADEKRLIDAIERLHLIHRTTNTGDETSAGTNEATKPVLPLFQDLTPRQVMLLCGSLNGHIHSMGFQRDTHGDAEKNYPNLLVWGLEDYVHYNTVESAQWSPTEIADTIATVKTWTPFHCGLAIGLARRFWDDPNKDEAIERAFGMW